MRALMPSEINEVLVTSGDLVELVNIPARSYYGIICIVIESPSHFAAKRHITYNNDWILAYSPKIKKEFQLKVGEYKKVSKSS